MPTWPGHYARCGEELYDSMEVPSVANQKDLAQQIEPWLAALLQGEHLALLVGNGLTRAVAGGLGVAAPSMARTNFECDLGKKVDAYAERSAKASGRGEANLEDQLRAAQSLIEGLRVLEAQEDGSEGKQTREWIAAYDKALGDLVESVLETERQIAAKLNALAGEDASGLLKFLLSFAHRPPTRERLEIFSVNYDRLLEQAADLLGIRLLDRFVGVLAPRFRASRLNVDMHFDPPGIRGEPRYLEGVARLTKLHGSLDWRLAQAGVERIALPFGPPKQFPVLLDDPYRRVMIYPNAAKDVETLAYPYAELFRDFAGALCRPNATLFVYGYGFGDDHVNRVIREMLTISSTHLVIISWGACDGRLERFCRAVGHEDQISLLVGTHFGDLRTLTSRYLPRTLVETIRQREALVKLRRSPVAPESSADPSPDGGQGQGER